MPRLSRGRDRGDHPGGFRQASATKGVKLPIDIALWLLLTKGSVSRNPEAMIVTTRGRHRPQPEPADDAAPAPGAYRQPLEGCPHGQSRQRAGGALQNHVVRLTSDKPEGRAVQPGAPVWLRPFRRFSALVVWALCLDLPSTSPIACRFYANLLGRPSAKL